MHRLIRENVVERNRSIYSNTNRGAAVVKFFGGTNKTLPVTQEDNKFLPMTIEKQFLIDSEYSCSIKNRVIIV